MNNIQKGAMVVYLLSEYEDIQEVRASFEACCFLSTISSFKYSETGNEATIKCFGINIPIVRDLALIGNVMIVDNNTIDLGYALS